MPLGMLVMKWDDRAGVETVATYPDNVDINEPTLLQVYTQHEYTGEAGLITLNSGAQNIASYYTGPEGAMYVVLICTVEEDGESFEFGLAEITRTISANIHTGALQSLLPSLFQRLAIYPKMNSEQKIANVITNELKKEIILRLQEDVLINKSELMVWLKDQYKDGFFDLDTELTYLIHEGLIKIASIQGQQSDIVFLVKDLLMMRLPPKELILHSEEHHLPKSLVKAYYEEVRSFFQNYKSNFDDALKITEEVILDPQAYSVFQLMRQAFVTRNDLEKLKKKGVDDVDEALKKLWNNKMIVVLEDSQKNEYYCLLSDFEIKKVYPEYNINLIKNLYQSKVQNKDVLIEALEILKEEYYLQESKTEEIVEIAET